MKLRKTILCTILVACFGQAAGAVSDFEQMVESLNKNSIPLVNLTFDGTVNKDDYIRGTIEIVDYQKRNISASLSVKYNCMIKYRGASSVNYSKKPFSVKLINAYGDETQFSILGMRQDDTWILDAMAIDRIRMRNRVCYDIWNRMSKTPYDTDYDNRNGTTGVFVELFLNGSYYGLYCLSDDINRKLLGLTKTKSADNVKGLMYKGVSWEGGYNLMAYNDDRTDTVRWNCFELSYPSDYPSDNTWKPLKDLIDFCSDDTDNATYATNWQNHFYKRNLVEYFVFTMALNVGDNLYKNTFLSAVDISNDQRFLITPWDMDMALGGNYDGNRYDKPAKITSYNYKAPYNRILSYNMDNIQQDIKDLWYELKDGLLSAEHVDSILDSYADMFEKSGAWARECSKWNFNPVPLTQSVWEELEYVKSNYRSNFEQLDAQMRTLTDVLPIQPDKYYSPIYRINGTKTDDNPDNLPKGLYLIENRKVLIK